MNKLQDTLSLCEHCYRHVPAMSFERDNKIWLAKTCKVHGYSEHLVEPDGDFYLNYQYIRRPLQSYFIEITNRCNLVCPHCYQMPNNTDKDPDIEYILDVVKQWPDNGFSLALVGAEPTIRNDLKQLILSIQALNKNPREIIILTNGVRIADMEYTKQFVGIDNLVWTVGLNHPEYQGPKVREKQMQGIKNLLELNLTVKCISYTLENLEQMEYCLKEIQQFGGSICRKFRIRCGADIGRYPGDPKIFMSDLVKEAKKICDKHNWKFETDTHLANRAHYSIKINGIGIKIIQWPDVRTIDLGEMQTEAIADMLPGKPPSPLVHQVMLRDALVNKKLPLMDTIPQYWLENYGMNNEI